MGLGKAEARRVSEIIEHFTPRQKMAFEALFDYRFVLYGGARGGGKSRFVRWALLLLLVYLYREKGIRGAHVGLFCDTYKELVDRQTSKIKAEFPPWLGEIKDSKTDGLGFYLSDENGGGVIKLRNLDDPSKYKSAEFAAIAVDELTSTTEDKFNILRGSLRWPGLSHTIFLGATNPGGVGHGWVKRYWIDRDFPPEMQVIASQFKFIQSLPSDNPYLDDVYWQDLNSLPQDLSRAWVHGDWDIFEGQAFGAFTRDRNVIPPVELPRNWPVWRGLDWGYAAPFACLWVAKDPDTQRIYVIREAYETLMTDDQQADLLKTMTPPHENIFVTYADPSLWETKNVEGKISTTYDEYRKRGVLLTKADNGRLNGKRKIDRLLSNLPDGKPGLMVFETCTNLIRTLPALPYDRVNVEDVDTKAEDHAYDALRYALTNYEALKVKTEAQQAKEKRRQAEIADARRNMGW